eukprot:3251000-Rhodomonas_salina.1
MHATASVAGEALTSFLSHDVSLSPARRGSTEGCDSAAFGFSYAVFLRCRLPSVSIFGGFGARSCPHNQGVLVEGEVYLCPPSPAVWVSELLCVGLSRCCDCSDSSSEGYVGLDAFACVPVVVDAFPEDFREGLEHVVWGRAICCVFRVTPSAYMSRVRSVGGLDPPSSRRSRSCPSRVSAIPSSFCIRAHSACMRLMISPSRQSVSLRVRPTVCLASITPGRLLAMPPCSGGRTNIATAWPSVSCHARLRISPHWSESVSRSTYRHAVRGLL